MKNFLKLLLAFLLVVFFTADAFADIPKLLLVKDIKPGTPAIGLSVFKGVEPKPFNVVLLEPVDAMGAYLVLIRISDGPMETPLEKIGAISGMSGSPIFIGCSDLDDCIKNGTLVGALSYSICVFCEGGPNAAMTPSENMLGAKFGGYLATDGLSRQSLRKITDTSGWKNLMLASGLQGGNGGNGGNVQLPRCSEFANSDIKPGSMITIFLAKGTMTMGVSGTVTWRDGDTVYAFGHPFTGSGKVNYPFSQISVADTLQTPVQASKIPGCELATHGALLMDGAFEVSGVVGQEVKLTSFDVHMFVGNQQIGLHEEIVYNSPMTTAIIRMLPAAWANQAVGNLEGISVSYMARMVIENQPEIYGRSIIPTTVFPVPFAELFNRVDNSLAAVRKSGFPHRLESIHVDIGLTNLKVWKKKDAFISKAKALPGETVHVHLVLEDVDNAEIKRISIPIKVPKDFTARIDLTDPASGLPVINVSIQDGVHFINPEDKVRKAPLTLEALIGDINKKMNPVVNVLYVQQNLPRTAEKRDEENSAAQSVELSVGKWKAVDVGELKQLPLGEKFDIVIDKTAVLEHYIDFSASFTINVDIDKKTESSKSEKEPWHKWFWIF